MSFTTRLRNVFRAGRLERELDEELRFHLDRCREANIADGQAPGEAELSAQQQFGDVNAVREQLKEIRIMNKWLPITFVAGIVVGVVATTMLLRPALSTRVPEGPEYYSLDQPGVTTPVVIHEVKPVYTAEAMHDKVSGTVVMTCIVQPTGVCERTQVTKSLDPRLDQEAMSALQNWRFQPGEYRGKSVPVKVTIEIRFRLS